MIRHSETMGKVTAAIAAVQREVGAVTKGSTNPHFGNTYADLNTFLHALSGPLETHGLTMMQGPGMADGWVTVDTLLVHTSGEWIASVAGAPAPKSDPQGAGSAITYLRRYSLAALFALPQEDDDGNAASHAPQERALPRKQQEKRADRATGEIDGQPACPRCSGAVWDNRAKKASGQFSAKSPDYSCRDKDGCGWVLWLDSAKDELRNRLAILRMADVITEASADNCLAGVDDGSLEALRIAEEWIKSKEDAA